MATKAQIKLAHKIARAIIKEGRHVKSPWAVGMSIATGTIRRGKRKR